jgi:hypothetical protein
MGFCALAFKKFYLDFAGLYLFGIDDLGDQGRMSVGVAWKLSGPRVSKNSAFFEGWLSIY